MDTPQALSLDHISVTLGHVPVLHDISLSVVPGEFLSIIGPNGCGKSTLLKVLCHMIRPQSGQAFLEEGLFRHTAAASWHAAWQS